MNPTTPQPDYKKKTRDFRISLIRNHILTGYPKTHLVCEDQKIAPVMDIFWIHQDSDQQKDEVPVSKSRWYFLGWWKGRLGLGGAEKSDLDQRQ